MKLLLIPCAQIVIYVGSGTYNLLSLKSPCPVGHSVFLRNTAIPIISHLTINDMMFFYIILLFSNMGMFSFLTIIIFLRFKIAVIVTSN